tara:strand:+ start:13 stop:207 length:195 start_codon:yes stop_codon:yes gene_type:complete
MYKIFLFLLIFVFSCGYQDIDTVPKFDSLNITMKEKIDKCEIYNELKDKKDDCFAEINEIINRL